MEDNSQLGSWVKWAAGALGLGAVVAALSIPQVGIWVAIIILLLAILLFGGYYLWRRRRARRQREQFSSAIEAQTAEAPKAISDPNKRAALDRVRQKFQAGLQEFKSRGKDIYKLPWFVIIGESGSGKTEAIRHSGIDFPPGLQDELQGSGGTINMDWWFTNRGIILDTAGSMIFNEARAGESPEWREFLRLLKKARPHSPINGLFLVLSIESLIKDSADKIAQKAGVLAQQLDMIQRTLDVRFPVYLLVTKSDLLTGFREFFDNVEDPLLQHQMFGWSNPDPLDAPFRPDLVEQHLKNVADRVGRRRLALLRQSASEGRVGDSQFFYRSPGQSGITPAPARRMDEVDKMFALPESIMRLAPRLRRYLETIFVAGEWSAKPVFLRGIYFTSSMREGKALDEAIAYVTGLPLDQLPDDRNWERNRAFFLRDLLHEKVFRESGLVTRASNTLKLLRQRQLAIFGTAAAALLLLTVCSILAYHNLKVSVLRESTFWQVGATNNPTIVSSLADSYKSAYSGTNLVTTLTGTEGLTLVQYQRQLQQIAEKPLAVNWIFKPLSLVHADAQKRMQAQRRVFETGVLAPLVLGTRIKMSGAELPSPGSASLARQRDALLSLIGLEADSRMAANRSLVTTNSAAAYLKNFTDYLTETDAAPDLDLVAAFVGTYAGKSAGDKGGSWPPAYLLGGDTLANNLAIQSGLDNFQKASLAAQTDVQQHLKLVNEFADRLREYHSQELGWLASPSANCIDALAPTKSNVDASWYRLGASTNFNPGPLTNFFSRYQLMADAVATASASTLRGPVKTMLDRLPLSDLKRRLFYEIIRKLDELTGQAADSIYSNRDQRASFVALLDTNCLAAANGVPAYQARWSIYSSACALASAPLKLDDSLIGDQWRRFEELKTNADFLRVALSNYKGPLALNVSNACTQIGEEARSRLEGRFVENYLVVAAHKLAELSAQPQNTLTAITNSRLWLAGMEGDLRAGDVLGTQADKLSAVAASLRETKQRILTRIGEETHQQAGFPVLLDSSALMDIQDLQRLRLFLSQLRHELQDPVWQADKSGALPSLEARCDVYAEIVNSLVSDDGLPGAWELWFVPPDPLDDNDNNIVKICRDVQFSATATPGEWKDVARDSDSVRLPGDASANSGVALSIRCNREDPSSQVFTLNQPNWGLVHLIKDSRLKAERLDDGDRWRFTVKLEVDQEGKHYGGHEVFEAKLLRGKLPKVEDWPK